MATLHRTRTAAAPTAREGTALAVTAGDGFALGATLYEPPAGARGPRATLLVNGATAAPQRYYARFAAHAASRGFRVLTYDYRGVGASRPRSLRGFAATLMHWARLDATAALARARGLGPEPVVLVGHSFGGQLLGLVDGLEGVAGALLVAAQFGYYGHWRTPLERARFAALWRAAVPAATAAFGYLPGALGLGEDLPAGVAEEWARWCLTPEYLLSHVPEAAARYRAFRGPALLYSFTDDAYAPRRAVDRFARALREDVVIHRRLSPADLGASAVDHFGFFRPAFENTLWREALEFADDAAAGCAPRARATEARARQWITEAEVLADLGRAANAALG